MDSNFREIMEHYNEATKDLVAWADKQLKTPFAETDDGKCILGLIAEIAKPSAMLMLIASMTMMEDVLLQMKADRANTEE